ncbi:MAG: IPT/TIG domain-containing protein [Dehalococcoidia bacterium]
MLFGGADTNGNVLQDTWIWGPVMGAAPVVSATSPSAGAAGGGTAASIDGIGLSLQDGATSVSFGPTASTQVTCSSTTKCVAISPPGSSMVDVQVAVGGLTSASVPADQFSYATKPLPPSGLPVSPAAGSALGGTAVTISGANFSALTSVMIGGARATFSAVAPNGSSMTVLTPPHQPLGDVNGDAIVNAVDALCVLRSAAVLPATAACPPATMRRRRWTWW